MKRSTPGGISRLHDVVVPASMQPSDAKSSGVLGNIVSPVHHFFLCGCKILVGLSASFHVFSIIERAPAIVGALHWHFKCLLLY